MKRLLLAGVLTLALAATGVAIAGGWATVQLSSTPTGLGPGDPWNLDITVLQHGNPQTPVLDATPRLTIENTETGAGTTYEATPTDKPGVYHVRAVFPEAGVWSYRVYDGFGTYGGAQWHTFSPVTIGEQAVPTSGSGSSASDSAVAPASDEGSFPVWPVTAGVVLGLFAIGLALVARRGRAATPAQLS
jgi:hypothetical protein